MLDSRRVFIPWHILKVLGQRGFYLNFFDKKLLTILTVSRLSSYPPYFEQWNDFRCWNCCCGCCRFRCCDDRRWKLAAIFRLPVILPLPPSVTRPSERRHPLPPGGGGEEEEEAGEGAGGPDGALYGAAVAWGDAKVAMAAPFLPSRSDGRLRGSRCC